MEELLLREIAPDDAARLLELQHRLDEENSFMLLGPDERLANVQQVKEMIGTFAGGYNVNPSRSVCDWPVSGLHIGHG